MRKKAIEPYYPVDRDFADTVLAESDKAISQIVEHRNDPHATEYWVFHKDLFDQMPNKEAFNVRYDIRSLRKEDAPCWIYTDNDYIAPVPVINELYKSDGTLRQVTPKAYFIKGNFYRKSKVQQEVIAYVDSDYSSYNNIRIKNTNREWIGGSADKDPRLKAFIEAFLKTEDAELAYMISFKSGDMRNGLVKYHVDSLLKRKDVVEMMDKEVKKHFAEAFERLGINDSSVEEYIVSKRLKLIERVLDSKSDKHLHLADNALKSIEALVGMTGKSKTTFTQQDTIKISLSDADRKSLLATSTKKTEGVEEAEVAEIVTES